MSGRVFQDLGAAMLKARSPSLSLDRGKNRSRFYADLRTVDRVDSVETGCSKVEMCCDVEGWNASRDMD